MIEMHVIDAFADKPFRGNPAAVCLLERYPSDPWLQQVAMEMNLSETAFLSPQEDGSYRLRWFTPTVEVDLCGHATLASAHYLWETERADRKQALTFHTLSGQLTASQSEDGWIRLDFPVERITETDAPDRLADALGGAVPRFVGTNGLDLLVELDSEEAVRELKPNFTVMAELGVRGVLITARSQDERYDFASRCFFPALGIDEDPVTGSAHCALAPYWQDKLGKDRMTAIQSSARTGVLRLALVDDRLHIHGQAVTALKGSLLHIPTE
ncbi:MULTISPECIES: PhzF family phenazine biosynthesis protein [Paenibacillus]|uniref:PhzF family phenazine biosynthesis protein n=1 Tax=Paenibacillus TaxID=44249 RepID=UPI000FD7FAD4|nr:MULTISPECIES: PhzF family phenazine biosynthesis protein [Paenibacillus]NEN80831.1 PhzF family phenazine biosynthesis protein [Paenibacillus elgii]GLI09841.1 isomerase [Paenibacillus tyrfis]